MNKKELKNIAKKLAAAEQQLENCADRKERQKLEDLIFDLSSKITNLNDMELVDEMVQEILSQP